MATPDRETRVITLGPFTGSKNNQEPHNFLTTLYEAQDLVITGDGQAMVQRPAMRQSNLGAHANLDQVTAMWAAELSNGSDLIRFVFAFGDTGRIYYGSSQYSTIDRLTSESVTHTAMTGASSSYAIDTKPTMAVMNDTAHFTGYGSTITPFTYDGPTDTWANLTALGPAGGTGFYQAYDSCVANDQVYLGRLWEQDTPDVDYPNRIRYSDPAAPTTWTSTNFIDVSPDDGDLIMRLIPFQGSILVIKQRNVYVLAGASSDSYQLYYLGPYGTVAPKSVVVHEDAVYWWDIRYGLVKFDGDGFTTIPPFNETDLAIESSQPASSNVAAWIQDNRVHISVPTGTSTNAPHNDMTLVYHLHTGTWTKFNFSFDTVIEYPWTGQGYGIEVWGNIRTGWPATQADYRNKTTFVDNQYFQDYIGATTVEIGSWIETGWVALEEQQSFRIERIRFKFRSGWEDITADRLLLYLYYDREINYSDGPYTLIHPSEEGNLDWCTFDVGDIRGTADELYKDRYREFQISIRKYQGFETVNFGIEKIYVYITLDDNWKDGY